MKKDFRFQWNNFFLITLLFTGVLFFAACGDDDPVLPEPPRVDPPTATFSTGTVEGLMVSFVNASVGADSYAWNFGDGNTSTEESPTHTYRVLTP